MKLSALYTEKMAFIICIYHIHVVEKVIDRIYDAYIYKIGKMSNTSKHKTLTSNVCICNANVKYIFFLWGWGWGRGINFKNGAYLKKWLVWHNYIILLIPKSFGFGPSNTYYTKIAWLDEG